MVVISVTPNAIKIFERAGFKNAEGTVREPNALCEPAHLKILGRVGPQGRKDLSRKKIFIFI